MSVGRICSRTTHLADPEESVQVAAERMKKQNVGTLVVLDSHGRPAGIVTDRDLALRVVASGLDPRTTNVGQTMTVHPRWARETTPIEDAVATMRSLGVRRLLVVDDDERLIGILSVDDVLDLVTDELDDLSRIVGFSGSGIELPEARSAVRREPAGLQHAKAEFLRGRLGADPREPEIPAPPKEPVIPPGPEIPTPAAPPSPAPAPAPEFPGSPGAPEISPPSSTCTAAASKRGLR